VFLGSIGQDKIARYDSTDFTDAAASVELYIDGYSASPRTIVHGRPIGGGELNVSVSRALLGTERNRKREWMPVSLGTPKSESLCSSFSRYNPLYVRWASWPDRQRTRNSLVAEGLVITKLHGNGSCEKIFGRAVSIKTSAVIHLKFFIFLGIFRFPFRATASRKVDVLVFEFRYRDRVDRFLNELLKPPRKVSLELDS